MKASDAQVAGERAGSTGEGNDDRRARRRLRAPSGSHRQPFPSRRKVPRTRGNPATAGPYKPHGSGILIPSEAKIVCRCQKTTLAARATTSNMTRSMVSRFVGRV